MPEKSPNYKDLYDIKKGKQEFYGGIEYESERRSILENYGESEHAYNDYAEKRVTTNELLKVLGNNALGKEGQHPSGQIYAFELLNKSLAEATTEEERKHIIEEILFDTAAAELPAKKEYLLGILAYYSSKEREQIRQEREKTRLEQINNGKGEVPRNAHWEDESKIFAAYKEYLEHLKQNVASLTPEMKSLIELIGTDFPKDSQEGQIARLIAAYYAAEPHPTSPPLPKRTRIIDITANQHEAKGGSGVPRLVYMLEPGYHTSAKKIHQAEVFGIPLYTELSQTEKTGEGDIKTGIVYDIDPQESLNYITRMRQLLGARKFAEAENLQNEYRDKLWEQLDEATRQALGGIKENAVICVQTIRDWSMDEAPDKAMAAGA